MENDKYRKFEKAQDYLLSILIIIAFLVIYFFTQKIGGTGFLDSPENFGVMGDYFGGILNPILGFFSFLLLLLNLYFQRIQLDKTKEQLELNKTELELTRKELEKSANAQIESSKLMNEQLRSQYLQQFENNFYHLFNQLNDLQDKLFLEKENEIEKILKDDLTLHDAREAILENRFISRYFMLLYQLLKLIDVTINLSSDGEKFIERKKFYTNLIRSQQDVRMLKLLFINCYKDFPKYKKYLENANFFEHMPFGEKNDYSFKLLACLKFYLPNKMTAFLEQENNYFEKSDYYKDIKHSHLMQGFYPLTESYLENLYQYKFILDFLSEYDLQNKKSLSTDEILTINIFKILSDFKLNVSLDISDVKVLEVYGNIFDDLITDTWKISKISKNGINITTQFNNNGKIEKLFEINFNFIYEWVTFYFTLENKVYEYKFKLRNE